MGTAKGGYEGFWDKRLDFMGRQAVVRSLSTISRVLDISAGHSLVPADRSNEIPPGPELVAENIACLMLLILRNTGRAFLFPHIRSPLPPSSDGCDPVNYDFLEGLAVPPNK